MTRIAVAIVTAGRRDILSICVAQLSKQTRLPEALFICPAALKDIDESAIKQFPSCTEIIVGPVGSSHQRNAIMRRAANFDIWVFLDDDFLADPEYVAVAEQLFNADEKIVVASGAQIVDGAGGPGISVDQGITALENFSPSESALSCTDSYSGYGCNMVVRSDVARNHNVFFDERLPGYGWWEDVDFCRRLSGYGRIVRSRQLRGVHLGSKNGKSPGKRLGYSQVANLLYLSSKGSITFRTACHAIARHFAANLAGSISPEPWIDRSGRLRGNLAAFLDIYRGQLRPERALDQ
jgi:GT2 family glycosyltransferase